MSENARNGYRLIGKGLTDIFLEFLLDFYLCIC